MAKSKTVAVSDDDKWRAESDADTLIRAQEVLGDAKRKKAASGILSGRSKAAQAAAAQCGLEKKVAGKMKEMMGGK